MAIGVTTIPTELVKKLWSKQLWMEVQEDLFFKRFIGEGEASVIQKVSDLKKDNGD